MLTCMLICIYFLSYDSPPTLFYFLKLQQGLLPVRNLSFPSFFFFFSFYFFYFFFFFSYSFDRCISDSESVEVNCFRGV